MSSDELARRRQGTAALAAASSPGSADDDRRLAAEDRRQAARYLSATYRDDTTGALSRRAGRDQMQVVVDRSRRDASGLTVIFIDVDGLKQINDSQGHEGGDALLAAVGTALRTSLRSYDLVVRYGGDEFVCGLPGGTAAAAEQSLARVRAALGRLVPGATISAGWAELRSADTIDDVIHRADADLYRARHSRHTSAGGRLSAASTQPQRELRASVGCGMCGGRVALADFVLELTARMTRTADCADCGATTVIELGQVLPLGPGGPSPSPR